MPPNGSGTTTRASNVKGKTVIVLVNDPGYATGDPQLFDGKAMTWYGRWVYKYEQAARMGAAACFIVHTSDDAAGYPWTVVRNSNGGPLQSLPASAAPGRRLAGRGLADPRRRRAALPLGRARISTASRPRRRSAASRRCRSHATASLVLRSSVVHGRSYNVLGLDQGPVSIPTRS